MNPIWNRCMELFEMVWLWLMQPISSTGWVAASLRELTFPSVLIRLALAVFLGGIIGLERGRKKRPAGFRTYMLVCMGASLSMILGQYIAIQAMQQGTAADMTRIGAQVINGIGFLGAGTILLTHKQQVKGLTTAAALWACACMGLAVGAGFYECVLLAFVIIYTVILALPRVESFLVEKSRIMEIYVEVFEMEDIRQVIDYFKRENIRVYDVDIDHPAVSPGGRPNAVFSIGLRKNLTHTGVIQQMSDLDAIYSIQEL